MSESCSPYLDFFSPTRFSCRVFGATYRHWGRGHQFHSQESLTSAHRVTKRTRPSECHLSAGGCGALYQATGEGLGRYSEAACTRSWNSLQYTLPATTTLALAQSSLGSLHDLGLASTEGHLLLACYTSVLKPTSRSMQPFSLPKSASLGSV